MKKKPVQKTKTIRAWMVVWSEWTYKMYGISRKEVGEQVVGCEISQFLPNAIGIMKNNKQKYADYALFATKKSAKEYHRGNKEWTIVPCTITYTI